MLMTDGSRGGDVSDRRDFADADRGLVGTLEPMVVTAADGRVVWDMDQWSFLDADCPDTADPSLWRQAQLTAKHGLYEVSEGIYQVRGFDMSNMTLVEGDRGIIVIDPLISAETAAAALALYRRHRGDRPVSAVIYTHAHLDHFGGVLGVVDADTDVPILAPEHFLEHAVSENVYAGVAMLRRSYYYAAIHLAKSPTGTLGIGLGAGGSTGTPGLIAPTLEITHTGQEETVDGVRMVFQMTPGTECPAEMNLAFPDKRALCMAENATHNFHNLLTLRGAQVRDPRIWSRYLAEAIDLFARDSDVVFASHHWPTWGTEDIVAYLTQQRDLYAYLHDQTLRLINQGYVAAEIAEMIEMPPALEKAWHTHGYYGSVNHNVKAIYQRYLGWYDANPAHLWQHPPEAAGEALRRGAGRPGGRRRHRPAVRRRRRPALRRRARQPRRLRRSGRPGRAGGAGRGPGATRLRRRERDVAQRLPDGRPRAPRYVDRAHRARLVGDGAGPDRHPAVRLGGHPRRRGEGVGGEVRDRLDPERHRRALPHGGEQRRAHPPPHRRDTGRGPGRDADAPSAARAALLRHFGRHRAGRGRGRPRPPERVDRRAGPRLRHRHALARTSGLDRT